MHLSQHNSAAQVGRRDNETLILKKSSASHKSGAPAAGKLEQIGTETSVVSVLVEQGAIRAEQHISYKNKIAE